MIGPVLNFLKVGGKTLLSLGRAAKNPAVKKFGSKALKSKGFAKRLTSSAVAGKKGLITKWGTLSKTEKYAAATVAGGGAYVANKALT